MRGDGSVWPSGGGKHRLSRTLCAPAPGPGIVRHCVLRRQRPYSPWADGSGCGCLPRGRYQAIGGSRAIGHNRYSTTGQSHLKNVQPFVVEYSQGPIAISHNGNLVNAEVLRKELEDSGSIFQSTSDTEVIIHLIATSKESTLMGRIVEALSRARGACWLLFLTLDRMIAARDPMGFRPLVFGRFNSGPNEGAYVVASETCALDLIEATYEREVEPGEIITFGPNGIESLKPFPP